MKSSPGFLPLATLGTRHRGTAIAFPYRANRLFVIETIRYGRARRVRGIPAAVIEGRCLRPAARHLQIAVGVGLFSASSRHSAATGRGSLALVRKPTDFVVAPDPESPLSGFPRMLAHAVVIELHQVRQVFALPAAVRSAALAAEKDAVEISDLQDGLLRMVGNFLDPQRERMEVEQQLRRRAPGRRWEREHCTAPCRGAHVSRRRREPAQRRGHSDRDGDRYGS